MQTITTDGSGDGSLEIPSQPGEPMRIYVDKGSAAPTTGTVVVNHVTNPGATSEIESPAKDPDGSAISFDFSSVSEAEVTVIPMTSKMTVVVSSGGASKDFNVEAVPII